MMAIAYAMHCWTSLNMLNELTGRMDRWQIS